MKNGNFRAYRRGGSVILWTLAGVICLSGLGCAAEKSELTVTSLNHGQAYEQKFTRAFAGCDKHGDCDIVLASDATKVNGPGTPSLREIMHIHVLWDPGRKVKVDGPATTNAAVHWYVFTDDKVSNLIEYSGTAFVAVTDDDGLSKVEIRNATLHPTSHRGDLNDPIGNSIFDGTIVAKTSPSRVSELLSEIKTTLASAALDRSETAARTSNARLTAP